jgi:DNA polymerase-3 subunit beta
MAKEGNSNLVRLDVQEDILVITSNSQLGKVREEVNINLQGEGIQIAFNSRYLLDVLKSMEEEEIVIELTSSVSPCVIKGKNSNNAKYLVLPVRLVR